MNQQQLGYPIVGNGRTGYSNPSYGNNSLIMNTPYDNYMGGFNNQTNLQQQQLSSIQYLKCRPVSSKEEARASQIDLDGSLWVFTDVANDKIYTKQISTNGTAIFKTYSFTQEDENNNSYLNNNDYVTKQEFNNVIQGLMALVNPQTTEVKEQQTANKVINF